ncbi:MULTISPECIES: hypothetical protein [Haloferax]|uniref:Uncharacterized protein n=1 Tax=Haloferax marinum TaxID=2666143 RepID=A0A6A8G565_9EURY|nr:MULTISPECIES: hypothetical protein [Haloferax]KAB1196495.1 hypothetical protein Hfx1150_02755 [Haloferax sp. CBA1150]MRW95493.1 hypothetical protein [Haloferax marinum]
MKQKSLNRNVTRRSLLRGAASATLFAVVGTSAAGTAVANNETSFDLIAGGGDGVGTNVGSVKLSCDGSNLSFAIETTGWWCLTETHVHVADTVDGVPTTGSGNPIVGHFDHNEKHDCVTTVGDSLPVPSNDGTVVVAVHAVVETVDTLDYFAQQLPSSATISVAFPGGDSYFNLTVSGGTVVNGLYDSFCVDTDRTISPGATYTAQVYSSYESLPAGLIENPQNLDLVNYIINQGWVGTTSAGGYGTYTYGDVQRAIWTLVDDEVSGAGLGSWNQNRVNEILADTQANGEGFVPGCGDYLAVIFVPGNNQYIIGQVVVGTFPVPCEYREETAWAKGTEFGGKSWAMYVQYSCNNS